MPLNDTPLAVQSLSVTQNPIRQNFLTIEAGFLADHVGYGVAGVGKHNRVTFPLQVAAPVFAANEMGLFNQNTAITGRPDIWMARAAGAAFPITGYQANGGGASNGWTYLPSGLKMVWGLSTIVAPGPLVLNYQTAVPTFPGFTTFWMAPQLTRVSSGATATRFVFLNAYTQTTFTAYTNTALVVGTANVAWLAIGL